MTDMDITTLTEFVALANRLSPENLHCDGEISRADARRKEQGIRRLWRALETKLGRNVSEDEVWREWAAHFASRSEEKRVNTLRGFNNRHED